ncbi:MULTISPECIES: DUF4114 domain-containing protein [Pseudanabaena]|nr:MULTISPECIES: DUF4114 domain-containing protein [Pseudanabaena]MDG3495004.1 DUF4114 domain-containing protein [Pseudanabaena catenata USMAC16]
MESLDPNSTEFIHEAATRALSNSNLGHILIDDITNGAHFASGDNSGQYLGEQTFTMQAGDRFGMMLVPNGTVQTVAGHPDIGGDLRPLFSMATANPNDAYHIGQITDVYGDGKTFVFEDIRVDKGSDHDFNDLVFHLKGATGQAATFDQLIADGFLDPQKDWRYTEIGQQIAANADSYIADGKVLPGDPLHSALPAPTIPHTNVDQGGNGFSGVIGTNVEPNQGGALPDLPTIIKSSLTQDVIDQVGGNDPFDIYRVSGQQLAGTEISVLSGSTTISILNPQGDILSQQVFDRGTHTLNLPTDISGDVLLKFSSTNGTDSTYILQGFESQAREPFNIDLEFASGITASQQAIIREAANFVQSLIGQGLPSAIVDGKIIDDVNFKISATNLDGTGGTLAQTKIDFMRYGTLLPAQSITQFDFSDLDKLEQSGELGDVVKHELLHGLGFGNLWEAKGLIAYTNTPLMQYQGKQAVQKFQELGGLTDAISLETAGVGSAGLHWHEALFQDEIMTADLSGGVGKAAISAVTLASLADLGYVVNLAKATPDYKLLGGQSFSGDGLTSEQVEAFRKLAEITFEKTDAEYIAPILPTVDPDEVAPEIWAHAEQFWKSGKYYDWVPYAVQWGDTLSAIALRTMGSAHPDNYWWIANHNGIPNPDYIVASDGRKKEWIEIPQYHPNYEWEQEQERLRREEELRKQQEEEERKRKEAEDKLKNDLAEQERLRLELERLRLEAEAKQRELDEQARRLAEELEKKRQHDEFLKEQARLAELARLAEIARQQGKGGQEWYFAKTLPEFGPVDPFETKLTGETVGNLVPDDYYRFTLSRSGRIDARLMKLLADADLVLYDARNRPISYSMREGITDEQILVDLIPGSYMLRVNSPKGVTTDYELVVKFKHLLSQSEQGPPPGWTVGGGKSGGGGATGPLFSDSRIQRIYDTALGNFAGPERAKANTQIANLKAEKLGYEQQMKALLDQMNGEQRAKVYNALDNARHNANVWVDNIANPIKNTVDSLGNGIIDAVNSVANRLESTVNNVPDYGIGWVRDRKDDAKRMINQGRDAVIGGVNSAKNWLTGKLNDIQEGVKSAVWNFFETIKNAYRTGAEINQTIANAAQDFRNKVDQSVRDANDLIGQFKGKVLSVANWTKDLGINVDLFGKKIEFNVYDNMVRPAVDNISGGVQSAINGVGNTLKGIVDWIEPRTQKVVADIVNALFGDKTGYLWNQINGVDAKIAATQTGLERAIAAAGQYILNVARQIEAFLTDPEERKRVLEALWKRGVTTVDDAYNFVKEELPKVRDKIVQEAQEALEKAKKAFANTVRYWANQILGNSSKREIEANLRLDKIIYGAADIRGGYKFEIAKEEEEDGRIWYTVATTPSIGLGFSAGEDLGGSFDAGYQSGNVKIAGQSLVTRVEKRVEGDLVLDTKIKYVFNNDSDEDMSRLGVWAFKEIPTPFDSVDSLLNLLIIQNYDSTEVSLNPYLTGELKTPWVIGQFDLSAINAGGITANGNYYRKIGLAFNAEGGFVLDNALQVRGDIGGKLVFTSESSLDKLESIELEFETSPFAANLLATKLGINDMENKIKIFNDEVKSEGKAVSNVKFTVKIKDPMKALSAYGSLAEDVIALCQSKGNAIETVNSLLHAIYQTNQSISYEIKAEARQALYVNAEASIKVGGKIGFKDTSIQEELLYSKQS